MSEETTASGGNGNGSKAIARGKTGGNLASVNNSLAALPTDANLLSLFGLSKEEIGASGTDFNTLASGGVSKWVDLKSFLKNPGANTATRDEVHPYSIMGFLVGRGEMVDENGKELTEEGEKCRYYFSIELVAPCPISVKSGDRTVAETAQPGDVVNIGERYQLQPLRPFAEMVTNGAKIAVVIWPWDKVAQSSGKTMWTFRIKEKIIRAPRIYPGALVNRPAGVVHSSQTSQDAPPY